MNKRIWMSESVKIKIFWRIHLFCRARDRLFACSTEGILRATCLLSLDSSSASAIIASSLDWILKTLFSHSVIVFSMLFLLLANAISGKLTLPLKSSLVVVFIYLFPFASALLRFSFSCDSRCSKWFSLPMCRSLKDIDLSKEMYCSLGLRRGGCAISGVFNDRTALMVFFWRFRSSFIFSSSDSMSRIVS